MLLRFIFRSTIVFVFARLILKFFKVLITFGELGRPKEEKKKNLWSSSSDEHGEVVVASSWGTPAPADSLESGGFEAGGVRLLLLACSQEE
jgi:hypothetical protein